MHLCPGVNQLCGYAHAVAGALHTPFHDMSDAELAADLAQVPRTNNPVLHHTRATDHFKIRDLREIGQNFILHAIGKEGRFLICAQVFEWQNRDAFFRNGGGRGTI